MPDMNLTPVTAAEHAPAPPAPSAGDTAARAAAEAFETAFLAEMLKYTGVNATPDGFGGGAGEDAFSSFLTQEYARLITENGGIGVAEQVFELLKQRTDRP
jgi:Rod binding domain-containing protein